MKKVAMEVVSNKQIALETYEMTLKNEYVCENAEPGQFLHISIPNFTLRRPISIASVEKETGIVTIIYKIFGTGTDALTDIIPGTMLDVIGPNGSSYPIDNTVKEALLVGGGVGVPPLYFLAKTLKERGVKVHAILGYQTKDAVFYEAAFQEVADTHIVTNDGTYGHKGLVTDIIPQIEHFDAYFSCGPMPMLKAVSHQLSEYEGYLSFEERMGCGVGTCFACVIPMTTDKKYGKICQDGPVFRAKEVIL